MLFSGRTATMSNFPLVDNLQFIKRVGFDGVEIALLDQHFHFVPELLEKHVMERVCSETLRLGLAPVSVSCHMNYVYDDAAFSAVQKAIARVCGYGSNILIVSNGPKQKGYFDKDEWNRLVVRTRELAKVAEDCGVLMAHEFEPGFIVGTTQELLQLMDEVNSPNLVCNLDVGHSFLCDPDPLRAIADLGDRIVHGHVDNVLRGVHRHLPPQHGDMELPQFFAALQEVRFTGALALDLYGVDYRAVASDALGYLRSLDG